MHCGVPKRDEEVIKDRFLTTQQAAMGVGPKLDRSKVRLVTTNYNILLQISTN